MSDRTLLFYPTISLPRGAWLTRSLLYWDQVGSIVPRHIASSVVDKDLRLLWDEGLYRPFYPETFVRDAAFRADRNRLVAEFVALFKSSPFQQLLGARYGRHFSVSEYRTDFGPGAQLDRKNELETRLEDATHQKQTVYNTKVVPELLKELARLKDDQDCVAFVSEFLLDQANAVVLLEPVTAGLYMALLAKYLAQSDSARTTIGTDQDDFDYLMCNPAESSQHHALYVRLSSVLPAPRPNVSVETVVKFRKKHLVELLRFRTTLDEMYAKMSTAEDPSVARDIATSFRERLQQGTEELSAKLRESGISAFTSSLRTLIDLKSPTLLGALAVASGAAQKMAEIPFEWSVAGLASFGVIQVGTQLIDARTKQQALLRDSPFAYLYRGQRTGILRPYLWTREAN